MKVMSGVMIIQVNLILYFVVTMKKSLACIAIGALLAAVTKPHLCE